MSMHATATRSGICSHAALLALVSTCSAAPACGQTFPTKPIRILVGYQPGGAADLVSRLVAKGLTEKFGQSVIVDNHSGAGGFIANDIVAKSPPDGYTLLLANSSFAYIPALFKKLDFDIRKDYTAVALVATTQNLLAVNPGVQVNSVRELIAFAKANPGKLSYASGGIGGSTHLSTELFKSMTGTDIVHIAYKGNGPSITDLISGQVDLTIAPLPALLPFVTSGKLKALASSGIKRSPLFPNLPTIAEAGVPGYDAGSWYGYMAPAKTPAAIVATLSNGMIGLLTNPKFVDQLQLTIGAESSGLPSDKFAAFIKGETEKWGKVIKIAGIKGE